MLHYACKKDCCIRRNVPLYPEKAVLMADSGFVLCLFDKDWTAAPTCPLWSSPTVPMTRASTPGNEAKVASFGKPWEFFSKGDLTCFLYSA